MEYDDKVEVSHNIIQIGNVILAAIVTTLL